MKIYIVNRDRKKFPLWSYQNGSIIHNCIFKAPDILFTESIPVCPNCEEHCPDFVLLAAKMGIETA